VRQRANGFVEALRCERLRFTASRAEAGAPEQSLGLGRTEGAGVAGNSRHQVLLPLSPDFAIP
jgi:hypothetical protein